VDGRLVDDVGDYQILGGIALSTENEPDCGEPSCHFDDFAAAFAVINATQETYGRDRR